MYFFPFLDLDLNTKKSLRTPKKCIICGHLLSEGHMAGHRKSGKRLCPLIEKPENWTQEKKNENERIKNKKGKKKSTKVTRDDPAAALPSSVSINCVACGVAVSIEGYQHFCSRCFKPICPLGKAILSGCPIIEDETAAVAGIMCKSHEQVTTPPTLPALPYSATPGPVLAEITSVKSVDEKKTTSIKKMQNMWSWFVQRHL